VHASSVPFAILAGMALGLFVPAYVDSAYFIVFNRTLQGILEVAADINVALPVPWLPAPSNQPVE
jgi:hypothetical protein